MAGVSRDGERATVQPQGAVAAAGAEELKAQLARLVGDGVVHLTLDFGQVLMVDSMGIGVVIAAFNSVRNCGGSLKVVNLPTDVGSLFHTMRLDRHFEIHTQN